MSVHEYFYAILSFFSLKMCFFQGILKTKKVGLGNMVMKIEL